MNLEEKKDFIFFRLNEAEESLNDSDLLLKNKSYRSSINRSYYSMFYSILALVNISGANISKHAGVISFFDKEFIKTGIFSKEFSTNLHNAFELRQESDYLDMKDVTFEEASEIYISAKNLFYKIIQYISDKYSLFYKSK